MKGNAIVFTAAVEGIVDEVVLSRIVAEAGAVLYSVYGKQGKNHLYQKLNAYNSAAKYSDWIVLVDLDHDADCAPTLFQQWLPSPSPKMIFRIAVREIESWLIADGERLAKFLKVPLTKISDNPEVMGDSKAEMVNLARASSSSSIRKDMIPRQGSGIKIGPAYPSRLIEFATNYWRPKVAAKSSESLRRCITKIENVVKQSR